MVTLFSNMGCPAGAALRVEFWVPTSSRGIPSIVYMIEKGRSAWGKVIADSGLTGKRFSSFACG